MGGGFTSAALEAALWHIDGGADSAWPSDLASFLPRTAAIDRLTGEHMALHRSYHADRSAHAPSSHPALAELLNFSFLLILLSLYLVLRSTLSEGGV